MKNTLKNNHKYNRTLNHSFNIMVDFTVIIKKKKQ